ncbi:hypothetical protein Z043_102725 [Scleropages formosus]|uniref:Peptidase M12B propeptide domain-containing protein n=1 Tax=Scleropages formosus TaxID=113540 RepID=A0A0P7VUK3_SCLFO|nr:hypothetical protein Z043_102725 [Scleropages formosus]
MPDRHAIHLLLLPLLLLSTALKATPANWEEDTDLVVPLEIPLDQIHLLKGALGQGGRRRGHRSLEPTESLGSEGHEGSLWLVLPAFGKYLYLQLRRDVGFLSEDFVIEEKKGNETTRLQNFPSAESCFYTGRVLNHTNSFVSLSTCGGLTGVVHTGYNTMFIEPVAVAHDSFSGVEHKVVRQRRSTEAQSPVTETRPTACGIIQGDDGAPGATAAQHPPPAPGVLGLGGCG